MSPSAPPLEPIPAAAPAPAPAAATAAETGVEVAAARAARAVARAEERVEERAIYQAFTAVRARGRDLDLRLEQKAAALWAAVTAATAGNDDSAAPDTAAAPTESWVARYCSAAPDTAAAPTESWVGPAPLSPPDVRQYTVLTCHYCNYSYGLSPSPPLRRFSCGHEFCLSCRSVYDLFMWQDDSDCVCCGAANDPTRVVYVRPHYASDEAYQFENRISARADRLGLTICDLPDEHCDDVEDPNSRWFWPYDMNTNAAPMSLSAPPLEPIPAAAPAPAPAAAAAAETGVEVGALAAAAAAEEGAAPTESWVGAVDGDGAAAAPPTGDGDGAAAAPPAAAAAAAASSPAAPFAAAAARVAAANTTAAASPTTTARLAPSKGQRHKDTPYVFLSRKEGKWVQDIWNGTRYADGCHRKTVAEPSAADRAAQKAEAKAAKAAGRAAKAAAERAAKRRGCRTPQTARKSNGGKGPSEPPLPTAAPPAAPPAAANGIPLRPCIATHTHNIITSTM